MNGDGIILNDRTWERNDNTYLLNEQKHSPANQKKENKKNNWERSLNTGVDKGDKLNRNKKEWTLNEEPNEALVRGAGHQGHIEVPFLAIRPRWQIASQGDRLLPPTIVVNSVCDLLKAAAARPFLI